MSGRRGRAENTNGDTSEFIRNLQEGSAIRGSGSGALNLLSPSLSLLSLPPYRDSHALRSYWAAQDPGAQPIHFKSSSSAGDTRTGTLSHTSESSGELRLSCPICEKGYKGLKTLSNHLQSRHGKVLEGRETVELSQSLQALACGYCSHTPFSTQDEYYNHVAGAHGRGENSTSYDFSQVIRNHLGCSVLQGHYELWLRTKYPLHDNPRPTLCWKLNATTRPVLWRLQYFCYSTATADQARQLVEDICCLKDEAKQIRTIQDQVTPARVDHWTYGAVGPSVGGFEGQYSLSQMEVPSQATESTEASESDGWDASLNDHLQRSRFPFNEPGSFGEYEQLSSLRNSDSSFPLRREDHELLDFSPSRDGGLDDFSADNLDEHFSTPKIGHSGDWQGW